MLAQTLCEKRGGSKRRDYNHVQIEIYTAVAQFANCRAAAAPMAHAQRFFFF